MMAAAVSIKSSALTLFLSRRTRMQGKNHVATTFGIFSGFFLALKPLFYQKAHNKLDFRA